MAWSALPRLWRPFSGFSAHCVSPVPRRCRRHRRPRPPPPPPCSSNIAAPAACIPAKGWFWTSRGGSGGVGSKLRQFACRVAAARGSLWHPPCGCATAPAAACGGPHRPPPSPLLRHAANSRAVAAVMAAGLARRRRAVVGGSRYRGGGGDSFLLAAHHWARPSRLRSSCPRRPRYPSCVEKIKIDLTLVTQSPCTHKTTPTTHLVVSSCPSFPAPSARSMLI